MSGRAPHFHGMTGEQQIAHTANVARPLPPHGATAAPARDDEPPIQPLDDQLSDEDLSLAGAEHAPPPSDEEFAELARTMKFDELRKQLRRIDLEESILNCDRDIDGGDGDEDKDEVDETTLPQTSRPLEKENDREELGGVDLPYLIACILRNAAKPFHDEQLVTRSCESQGNQFKCPTCAKLPGELRRDKTRDRAFGDRGKLNRHIKEVHSRWMDLVLEMVTEDPNIFVCPSGDFKAPSVSAIREHCLSEKCVDQITYLELVEEAGIKLEDICPSIGPTFKLDHRESESIHLSGDKIDDELDGYIPRFGSADSEIFKDISAADAFFEDIPNFVYRGSEAGLVDTTNDDDMEAFWAAHPDRYKVMTIQDLTDGSWSAQDILNELERTGKRASTLAVQCIEELCSALAEVRGFASEDRRQEK
ncbi:hypothetical protein SCHPADRAFT_901669 [Schizopora paradoxa]|uniref:Uncharacterized protein n=1 Tax=Schizopora paradoxa TaxID=27342 RepID=A0A0H2S3F5_9AGAM|nr:hypothetical protein SCHPADRAFT_901669 [Schizopora paradoxa]